MMNKVKLKNGTEEEESLVNRIASSLKDIWNNATSDDDRMDKFVAICELLERASNSSCICFERSEEILKNHSLMNKDGSVPEAVRNVALSSIERDSGTGNMNIVSPVAE